MTELLYQTDSYQRTFEARVQEIDAECLALERTVFYPTGGGQPHDLGRLLQGSRVVADVVEVRRRGETVWHTAPGHALQRGDSVRGEIDWTRRYELMRTHTALHILSAVVWRDFGAQVTGGNMEPLQGRLDFELGQVPEGFVEQIEAAVNAEVQAARDVVVRILPRQEALRIPDLIRTKVNLLPADIRMIRTVQIVGLDLQADGGTHVANTREIGRVQVVNYKSKGKDFKRLRVQVQDA